MRGKKHDRIQLWIKVKQVDEWVWESEALIMVKVIDDYIHMKKEVFVC